MYCYYGGLDLLLNNLTIVIPVKEDPRIVEEFIKGNMKLLIGNHIIVVNRSGGEALKPFSTKWLDRISTLWGAREEGLSHVGTDFVLNLDANKILPEGYIEQAMKLFDQDSEHNIAVIAIDHEDLMGHLSFGTSIWRTNALKVLYNWTQSTSRFCECTYMWSRVRKAGFRIETLNMRAIHLKKRKDKGEQEI